MVKAIEDSLDDIPEGLQEFYTEKNGKYELTGIEGVKTQADVDRVNTSLRKANGDIKELKDKYKGFDTLDMSVDDIQEQLDRIPELEEAGKGQIDEAKLDEMANTRADKIANTKLVAMERKLSQKDTELGEITGERDELRGKARQRTIHDTVRSVLTAKKVIPEAFDDALMLAERHLEITDDGEVLTKENVSGITGMVKAEDWLEEVGAKRAYWFPPNQGGGGRGGGGGGGGVTGDNPWSHDHWNKTAQSKYYLEHGADKAHKAAKAAGTSLNGEKPKKK